MRIFYLRLLFISFLLLPFGVLSKAALTKQPFEYYGEGDSLRKVLTALASNADISVNVSSTIDEKFNGHLRYASSLKALDYLASAYDLIWYFDGATLHINRSSERQSQMIRLELLSTTQLKQTMQDLKLWDPRFEWRTIQHTNMIMVSGPPRYIELINETVALLQDSSDSGFVDPLVIRIFKLNHASAIDRKFEVRGEEVVIPGIATLLGNMISGENRGQSGNVQMQGVDGTSSEQSATSNAHTQVSIQADASLNAVIIQDYRSRIDMYSQLIEQLDTPREQLEISLVIIDLTMNSLSEIGIDWATKQIKIGEGLVDLILPGAGTDDAETLTTTNADFLATVSLLETQGRARVTSRPAIVTENGLQALLDNNESFFVRVEGERVAELEEITYGTLLQVTPRIIQTAVPRQIYLDVNIQDGARIDDGGPESLPSIKNTQITTRAQVPEGASLLIGGYSRESNSSGVGKIPGVGDIPMLGKLFQNNTSNSQQMVRLFMISPKVMETHTIPDGTQEIDYELLPENKRIKQLMRLSNSNGHIFSLVNRLPCESAIEARVRRNHYQNKHYGTAIRSCRDLDGYQGYQVTLNNCPTTATEPECAL
ncbi:type III secretion system outer membrane ring subunit SctC [Pseudoalteromonas spongiae]|uniref:type III secretion system outer membrane ring subunit SctC n=1 Tax=Pseudoalteromonas spongiae TaxID=298657 RepID=UPI000C2D04DC|nr:type III secretion system outer membrane ring subunit SctC [Pseudoalteromonas spongiae]